MAPIQLSYYEPFSDEDFWVSKEASQKPRGFLLLPVRRRGSFFQDASFSDVRQEFDAAVREALQQWSQADLKWTDQFFEKQISSNVFGRYRQLRSRNLKNSLEAVRVTSDGTSRKVVMDVQDFIGGDIKVKVEGGKDLVVEGRVEKRGRSSSSSRAFRRRFSLPPLTDAERVSSVLSSDGVLTVTMPQKIQGKVSNVPIEIEGSVASSESLAEESTTRKEKRGEEAADRFADVWEASLPISRRGRFFQDSFFADFHREFEAIVREVLDRWQETERRWADRRKDIDANFSDMLGRYRRFRFLKLKENDHVGTVTSDDTRHKIVLDMGAFVDGDVAVKMAGERELWVEGRVETANGSSSTASHSLTRRFQLPSFADPSAVTSAMSSDGILTITTPKQALSKGNITELDNQNELAIPLKTQVEDTVSRESSLRTQERTLVKETADDDDDDDDDDDEGYTLIIREP